MKDLCLYRVATAHLQKHPDRKNEELLAVVELLEDAYGFEFAIKENSPAKGAFRLFVYENEKLLSSWTFFDTGGLFNHLAETISILAINSLPELAGKGTAQDVMVEHFVRSGKMKAMLKGIKPEPLVVRRIPTKGRFCKC